MVYLKYFIWALLSIPLLPILYFDGKRVRKNTPVLPAARNPSGISRAESQSSKLHLLLIGESTVAGLGVEEHKDGFTGAIAQELSEKLNQSVHWNVAAQSGFTVREINEQVLPALPRQPWNVIVIGIGGNDSFTLNDPFSFKKYVLGMITSLKEEYPDAPLVFVNFPPIHVFPGFTSVLKIVLGTHVRILSSQLARVVKSEDNVYFMDEKINMKSWADKYNLRKDTSAFFSDGIHPSQLTYSIWGKEVGDFILKENVFANDRA